MTLPAFLQDLSFIGLLYDMIGALLLSFALLFNSASSIAAQSRTHWDTNSHMRRGLCEQRVDSWFGLPLLAVGFLLQAIGFATGEVGWFGVLVLAGLPLTMAAYAVRRRSLIERLEKQVELAQAQS